MRRREFLESCGAAAVASCASTWGPGARATSPPAEDVRKRAERLHREGVVVVIHDHNPIEPDIAKMLAGGVTAKVYQIGLDVDPNRDFLKSAPIREGWSRRALAELDDVDRVLEKHSDQLLIAKSAADIRRAKREGKVAILLGCEGAKLLEGRVEMLQKFYDRGLRELQLRWGVPNQIVEEQILTPFGRQVVAECNRLRVIIGLTHIPMPAFHQVIEMTRQPPIVCHSIASRTPDSPGDILGDRQLKALTAVRGVVGLHFFSSYLGRKPTPKQVVDQVDYIANVVGIDTISLGIDLFPAEGAWKEFLHSQGSAPGISWAIPDIGHVNQVTEALVARNYSDEDIKKVLGENFLRVAKEVFGS